MSAYQEALARAPQAMTAEHKQVARILLGRPEGVDRKQAESLSGMSERHFRHLTREIARAGWLPTVSERKPDGTRVYKIAGPTEHHLLNANNNEDHSRAVKLNQCARGRTRAFHAFHQAGSLFTADVPDLEATA